LHSAVVILFSLELLGRAGLLAAGTFGIRYSLVGGSQLRVGFGQVLLVLELLERRLLTTGQLWVGLVNHLYAI